MKSFLSLLTALLLVCVTSVALFETLPRIKYNLQDPIYHRLKERIFSPAPAEFDIAFIGSSHIWNAVDTEMINRRRPGKFTYNFGVNWFGNDTKLVLLRDLLDHKPVRTVVLEITGGDDREVHHYFKFLATLQDATRLAKGTCTGLTMREILTLAPAIKSRIDNLAATIMPFSVKGLYFTFREFFWKIPPVPANDHDGFLPIASVYDFPDKTFTVSESDDSRSTVVLSPSLVEMGRICRERGVKLYFLFVPARNESHPGRQFLDKLRAWGEPVVIDVGKIYPSQYWYNPSHLNTKGAAVFTEEILQSAIFTP